MTYKTALDALSHCENQLRAELALAAQAGNYAAIGLLSQWAQTIAGLVVDAARVAGQPNPTSPVATVTSPTVAAIATTSAPLRPARKTKAAYPRFARTADALVKIGWSKKSKSEYEHKAPLALAAQLSTVAAKVGARGRLFSIDALSNAWAGEDSPPSYQHYVIVAWWRDAGLIDQHGRKGYSIPKPVSFVADATQCIDALPRHGS